MRCSVISLLLLLLLVGCRVHRYREVTEETHDTAIYEGQPADTLPPIGPRPPPPRDHTTSTTTVTAPPPDLGAQPPPPPPTRPSVSPHPAGASAETAPQFPVAKSVPGKPGFVYSPYDGAMIDVTGFGSGSKAKDPGTNKIFIVP